MDPQELWQKLDSFQSELQSNYALHLAAGTVAVTSLAISAGYVFWSAKGGYLIASMISNLPVWQFMDPLPIIDAAQCQWRTRKNILP